MPWFIRYPLHLAVFVVALLVSAYLFQSIGVQLFKAPETNSRSAPLPGIIFLAVITYILVMRLIDKPISQRKE
jgi:hypothetical protein